VKKTYWDKRYREGFYPQKTEPHALLQKFWKEITGKYVLDLAMGNGRDALYLAEKGFLVTGVDSSSEAIKRAAASMSGPGISMWPVLGDAESLPYKEGVFDCVIVFYFLERKIMEQIRSLARKGGMLMYETFLERQNRIDPVRNPAHLLNDGELISHFKDFELLYYEEVVEQQNGRDKIVARAVGRKQ
jgi:SAM-dependent methyltransferase